MLKNIVDVDQFKVVPMRIQRGLAWSGEVEINFENFARFEKHGRMLIKVNKHISTVIINSCNSTTNQRESASPNVLVSQF